MSRITLPPTSYLSGYWQANVRELELEEAEVRLTQTLQAIENDLRGIYSTQKLDVQGLLTPGMTEEQIQSIYQNAMGEIARNKTSDLSQLKERELTTPQTWDLFDTAELLAEIAVMEDRKVDAKVIRKQDRPEKEVRLRFVTDLARCLNEIGAQQKNPHLQERARYLLYLNYTIAFHHGGLYGSALTEMGELFSSWQ